MVTADPDTAPVLILGARFVGRLVAEMCVGAGRSVAGFLDDDPALVGTVVDGHAVLGPVTGFPEHARALGAAVALGMGGTLCPRRRLLDQAVAAAVPLARVVHPTAAVAGTATLEEGAIVCACATVNTGAVVGRGTLVEPHSSVGVDVHLGANGVVATGTLLNTATRVGADTFLASRVVTVPEVTIGRGAWIGVASVITEDVAPGRRVLGAPGRAIGRSPFAKACGDLFSPVAEEMER